MAAFNPKKPVNPVAPPKGKNKQSQKKSVDSGFEVVPSSTPESTQATPNNHASIEENNKEDHTGSTPTSDFENSGDESDSNDSKPPSVRELFTATMFEDDSENPKKTKKNSSNGFDGFGLANPLVTALRTLSYRTPTPIQRRTIPLILGGKSVFAMARTGSGKTAAFLLPVLHTLSAQKQPQQQQQTSNLVNGSGNGADLEPSMDANSNLPLRNIRAVILVPTRELVLQTLRVARNFRIEQLRLRQIAIIGGEAIGEQFTFIHSNPDIIIGTPGRLLHVLTEMSLNLPAVRYLIMDEVDRIFEMGLGDQLHELLHRIGFSDTSNFPLANTTRQALLFSATLPSTVISFTKTIQINSGEPILVRLDTEAKLPPTLSSYFVRLDASSTKPAALLHMLGEQKESFKIAVFVSTKHVAEYLTSLLEKFLMQPVTIYGTMDQFSRDAALRNFLKNSDRRILIVTDVAARGLDLPHLDVVINYDFPPIPKLYIHRVGRVARAGRVGAAYTILTFQDMPYYHDLISFLGGDYPVQHLNSQFLTDISGKVSEIHLVNTPLDALKRVADNSIKQFTKTKPRPTSHGVFLAKRELDAQQRAAAMHVAANNATNIEDTGNSESSSGTAAISSAQDFLSALHMYKSRQTIFELNGKNKDKSPAASIMAAKRAADQHRVKTTDKFLAPEDTLHVLQGGTGGLNIKEKRRNTHLLEGLEGVTLDDSDGDAGNNPHDFDNDHEDNIGAGFAHKSMPSAHKSDDYIAYRPANSDKDRGFDLTSNSFARDARNNQLDLLTDDHTNRQRGERFTGMVWDRKKKKYVQADSTSEKAYVTEAGNRISATYKADIYSKWLAKNKHLTTMSADQTGQVTQRMLHGRLVSSSKVDGTFTASGSATGDAPLSRDTLFSRELKKSKEALLQKRIGEKRAAKASERNREKNPNAVEFMSGTKRKYAEEKMRKTESRKRFQDNNSALGQKITEKKQHKANAKLRENKKGASQNNKRRAGK